MKVECGIRISSVCERRPKIWQWEERKKVTNDDNETMTIMPRSGSKLFVGLPDEEKYRENVWEGIAEKFYCKHSLHKNGYIK